MPSDRSGEIPSVGPAGRKHEPAQGNQSDADTEIGEISENDQRPAAENQEHDQNQEPRWRRALRYVQQHMPTADSWLAIFTFIVAVETLLTIRILSKTDAALHKTAEATAGIRQLTELDDRAWVAPEPPNFTAMPTTGQPMSIRIGHANVGRTPADNMRMSFVFDQERAPESHDFGDLESIQENFCETNPPLITLGPSYPFRGSASYFTSTRAQKILWSEDLANQKQLLRLRECFSFTTFGKSHRVWACYVFVPAVPYWIGAGCNGGSGSDWRHTNPAQRKHGQQHDRACLPACHESLDDDENFPLVVFGAER